MNAVVWSKTKSIISSSTDIQKHFKITLYLRKQNSLWPSFKSSCCCRNSSERERCLDLLRLNPALGLADQPRTDQWYDASALNGSQRSSALPSLWKAAYRSPERPQSLMIFLKAFTDIILLFLIEASFSKSSMHCICEILNLNKNYMSK